MNTKGLSLNTIPPLSIPLRFFLTAPFFGVLAALLILSSGPEIWMSRWNGTSLSLTHLLTIGFMLMIMIGVLYQFIPVMLGQLLPGSKQLVPIIHPLLCIGSIALSVAFLYPIALLYWTAFIALGLAMALFTLSLLHLLVSILENRLIIFLLRVLFIVLVMTIGMGLYMLLAYAYPELGISFREFTDIHALWGLIGWSVLLIMAVSSQVIPMFYVTPEFSDRILKPLVLFVLITLFLLSVTNDTNIINSKVYLKELVYSIFSIELLFFSLYTLRLINQRRRKITDLTINFFRLSLVSLLIVIVLWWTFTLLKVSFQLQYSIQFEFTLAILLIYGLSLSAIIGMLQKIVPFLIYLHLQRLSFKRPGSFALVPTMKNIISIRTSKVQFVLHLLSYLLLIISVHFSAIIWFAGFTMLGNFVWLGFSLFQGILQFKKNQTQILAYPKMEKNL